MAELIGCLTLRDAGAGGLSPLRQRGSAAATRRGLGVRGPGSILPLATQLCDLGQACGFLSLGPSGVERGCHSRPKSLCVGPSAVCVKGALPPLCFPPRATEEMLKRGFGYTLK